MARSFQAPPELWERPLNRRVLLTGGLAAAGLLWSSRLRPASASLSDVHPRSEWGADHPPLAPMDEERPEDVRFLLLHHSATPGNDYRRDQVPDRLRAYYNWHATHPDGHGWPDMAYNFLVDRFGGVWEGRAGSLDGPVKGDATGGSQGFALLCCFIGDHAIEPPTEAAITAMAGLCAALALRYGIDPSPGARTSFVSRGSNLWPAGTEVETATIAGHRDMSQTTCPGDAGYRVVTQQLPVLVAEAVGLVEDATQEPEPEPESGATADEQPSDEVAASDADEADAAEPDAAHAGGQEAGTGADPGSPHRREPHVELDRSEPPAPSDSVATGPTEPPGHPPPATATEPSAEPRVAAAERRRAGIDGLGVRELTVLGLAAAAGGAGLVARSRHDR